MLMLFALAVSLQLFVRLIIFLPNRIVNPVTRIFTGIFNGVIFLMARFFLDEEEKSQLAESIRKKGMNAHLSGGKGTP